MQCRELFKMRDALRTDASPTAPAFLHASAHAEPAVDLDASDGETDHWQEQHEHKVCNAGQDSLGVSAGQVLVVLLLPV